MNKMESQTVLRPAKCGLRPGGSTRNYTSPEKSEGANEKSQVIDAVVVKPTSHVDGAAGVKQDEARNVSISECSKSIGRFSSPGRNKQSDVQDPPKPRKKYSGNGGRRSKKKNKGRGQQQYKSTEELKISSRASLWANSEANGERDRDQISGGRSPGGSQARAKDVWAAARADILMKKNEQVENENINTDTTGAPISVTKEHKDGGRARQPSMSTSTAEFGNRLMDGPVDSNVGDIHTEDRYLLSTAPKQVKQSSFGRTAQGNNFSSYSFGHSRGHACGRNNAVRKEWERIDKDRNKSKLEEEMESLLALLNDAEVGTLSSRTAQLPMELPDGEGGTITTMQEQNLVDATLKIMDAWNYDHKRWTKDEARLAGQILLRMEKEEANDGVQDKLTKTHYLSLINAYAKVTDEDETASIRAENLLDHMEKRASEGRADLKADRFIINTVLGAQAKHALSGDLSLAGMAAAERMLDTLEREYARGDATMQPTSRTYSKFIDLYAKNGLADDAARALERMEAQYRRGNRAAMPKTIHYTSVIDAIAKESGSSNKARRAEDILRSMLDLYDRGNYHLAPDSVVFSATIDAYSKTKAPDAAERSLGILDLMDKYDVLPDIITFNVLLNTLMQNTHYFSKAKEILRFVEQSPVLRADSYTYNAVIKGCPPEDAEELIQHWEMEYKMGHTDERPDSYTYTALIKSWTFTNKIGYEQKAIDILRWMEEQEVVGMNRIVYNEVMRSFSRSNRDDAGELAEGVFNQLVSRYRQTRDREWRPDKYSYMAVVNAYGRSCKSHDRAAKAENFLFEMVEMNYRPDPKLFNNIISAWARSGSDVATSRAESVCDRMDVMGVEVDGVCFNSLINVYAKSHRPEKGIHALRVLERMNERNVAPTSVTYTLLFDACIGDEELLMQVFESCIKNGMLDEKLECSFREHGPACIGEELRGKIPYVWRENANRGPGGPSRNQIKRGMKKGSTGADVRRFGWAR